MLRMRDRWCRRHTVSSSLGSLKKLYDLEFLKSSTSLIEIESIARPDSRVWVVEERR